MRFKISQTLQTNYLGLRFHTDAPLCRREAAPGVGAAQCKTKANNQSGLSFSKEADSWVGPFVMAMVMAK